MRFAARFEGPPGTANGGVIAGALAGDGPAEVTIRRPVPVETDLVVGDGELRDANGDVLAAVRPVDSPAGDREVPRVDYEDAVAAGRATPLAARHPFPGCFGCGPDHPHGLHCLPGPVAGRDGLWAVGWMPEETVAPVVWAALDCPSSAPVVPVGGDPPHVLGRISGHLLEPVTVGEPHVVVAWALGAEGRRKHAASAVLGPDGGVRAIARATWIALGPR